MLKKETLDDLEPIWAQNFDKNTDIYDFHLYEGFSLKYISFIFIYDNNVDYWSVQAKTLSRYI